MTICPALLEPVFSPRPWGARSLAPFYPDKNDLAEPLGEAWLTGYECRFANGPFAGKKLGEAWAEMPVEWSGTALETGAGFPLLLKFIFAEDKLSVQVHPDDAFARAHEKLPDGQPGRGKTEMWYAVQARPGAEVLLGLKESVTRDALARSISDGTAEDSLVHVPMSTGDVIFVPAGTAHTIGPGLVLCEIQQYSDFTYRVFDYNRRDAQGRSRELHIEKALQVMRFGKQLGGKVAPVLLQRDGFKETFFVACRYFATEKWEFSNRAGESTSPRHFELLIFLAGCGSISWSGGSAAYAPAQAWLLPAALGRYDLAAAAPTSLLRTYVPENPADFALLARERGADAADAARLVFV
ncbi:MAG TPA: type I phosphomannose isomerase catalytic subunit [Verrucomicrobiae bacterium]|nr:type I phosphomannose isomerase catalytic subunit [Verrucomicrobiae bacterium]